MKNKKLIITIVLLILFTLNTYFVMSGKSQVYDDNIHNWITINFNSEVLDNIMNFFTFFGSVAWGFALTGLLAGVYFLKKNYKKSFSIATVAGLSVLINTLIKYIFKRPRPLYMMVDEATFSYPSGHTAGATAIYGFVIYMICKSNMPKGYKILFSSLLSILTLLIISSRLYLGAHYFSDILGGFILAILVLNIYDIVNDKYKLV